MMTAARWLVPLLVLLPALPGRAADGPKVPDGFEVRVVASFPTVRFPTQVATAPDGRVFVAEDPMDQPGPHEAFDGRILSFRDGEAEPKVFAQGLRAVFGMAWRDGALYVSHMPYLSVLRDNDGDGVAESRQDLSKDLGITDNRGLNDHIVSGIQFGIDGRLYISTGDKGVFHATGPDGKVAQLKGGGTLRCKPDGTDIEVLTTGTRNHLEPNLDAGDNLFTYDNTDDGDGWWTRVTHHVEGAYYGYPYDYHEHPDRFLNRIAEYGGGSPCGGLVYREDAWPEQYRGRVFWAEWGKRKVQAFRFQPDGASFQVADVLDFAQPAKGEFHPIDLALSFDGKTLYVADWAMGGWSSKTAQVGALYAITYKGPAVATRPRGSDADPLEKQFAQLDHPSYNERMRAQGAIIRAGKASAWDIAGRMFVDPAVSNLAGRHLVWIIEALAAGPGDLDLLQVALLFKSDDVRAQAIRALGERRHAPAAEALVAALGDPSPIVKLQAIVALGRIGQASAVAALVPMLTDPDRMLAFSARQAIRRIGAWQELAPTLKSGDPKTRAAVLAALEGVEKPGAVALLEASIGNSTAPADERAKALGELALVARKAPPWDGKWWGTRPTKSSPPVRSIDWEATPAIFGAIERGLADPAREVRLAAVAAVVSTADRAALPTLRARFAPGAEADVAVRAEVVGALGTLGDAPAVPALVEAIRDDDTPAPVRDATIAALEKIGGTAAVAPLLELLRTRGDTLAEPTLTRVILALGRSKAREATPALVARLDSPTPGIRAAAVEALGRLGPASSVAAPIRDRLRDDRVEVRKAALAALGRLGDRDSVPAMLPLAADEATRFEALLALTEIPDVRALGVYLPGLTDRSQAVRRASLRAMVAIRDEAAPALERLAARRELSPSSLPELRKVYADFRPVAEWQLLGPFPVEAPTPIDLKSPVDLAATVAGPEGKPLRWRARRGDAQHGAIELDQLFAPEINKKAVLAATTLDSQAERTARMRVGCDDTLSVWVNGELAHAIDGNHSYSPDMAEFPVKLRAGANQIVARVGNDGGPWKFSVAATREANYAFLDAPAAGGYDPDKFRDVALRGKGRPDKGEALFHDAKGLACARCHAVGGRGGAIGPNLSGVAAMYPRDELIRSVLQPSARIFSGYEATIVAAADGRVLTGLVRSDTADGLEIEDADGKRTRLARADVEDRKTSDVSIMPNGIVEGIAPADFADLIAYLETLKDVAANQGKPAGK